MDERQWDKLLHIRTSGRDDSKADTYHYPYEPTPYSVLERLANSGFIGKKNTLVDYGCGKGRVSFFLNYATGCKTVGVEYDENIYNAAKNNLKEYVKTHAVMEFVHTAAETYAINDGDRFFFFNPFSVEILRPVLGKLLDSYYENPREMLMFFYYPDDTYVSCLMTQPELEFVDEIECMDLFEGENMRERILIFQIVG